MADRLRLSGRAENEPVLLALSPSHLWQNTKPGKEKEDEEEEILAVLLSRSPSLPCSRLPGSAGRQMTRVCGRLITPGWVFSNLFNGSLLKKKTRWRRGGGRMTNTGGRQVSRPGGQGSQPSQGRNQRRRRRRRGRACSPGRDTREDQTTPEEEERKKKGEKTQET